MTFPKHTHSEVVAKIEIPNENDNILEVYVLYALQ